MTVFIIIKYLNIFTEMPELIGIVFHYKFQFITKIDFLCIQLKYTHKRLTHQ